MKQTIIAAALAATACIPPAPCRPGLSARLELGCHQIARHIEDEDDWGDAGEYLDECLAAVEAHAERCDR